MIYLTDGSEAELISTTFEDDVIPSCLNALPKSISLADSDEGQQWPIASVFRNRTASLVTFGIEGDEQAQALLLPISTSHNSNTVAVLVAGVNRYRALDKSYREWFNLAAGHIATAVTNSKVIA